MRARILLFAIVIAALLLVVLYLVKRSGESKDKGKSISVSEVLGGSPAEGYQRALAPRPFSFPEDHGPHPGFRNEWWYFTGNLRSDDGRSFGYQLTFFRVSLTPQAAVRASPWATNQVIMAHFALTDIEGKRFRFSERFSRSAAGLAGAGGVPLKVWLEGWSATETQERPWGMKLSAAEGQMAIDLELKSLKPIVLNGEQGLSRKSATPGNSSYYYSIPRMETSGAIRSGDRTFQVTGVSWLDREWSTSALERDQVGWDWFALHLDDGRDIMFYRLRKRDGTVDPFSSGTLIGKSGESIHLKRDDVQLEIGRWWTSPASAAKYPSLWRMHIPSQHLDLEIVPRLPDQELRAQFRYWEGAVSVKGATGSPGGEGYLEMTGYGKEPL